MQEVYVFDSQLGKKEKSMFGHVIHTAGADPGFLLGGGAPLKNDITIQDFS